MFAIIKMVFLFVVLQAKEILHLDRIVHMMEPKATEYKVVEKEDRIEVSVPPDYPGEEIADDSFCLNSSNPIINDTMAIESYTSTFYISGTPGSFFVAMAVNGF